jgi:hypothetical protein
MAGPSVAWRVASSRAFWTRARSTSCMEGSRSEIANDSIQLRLQNQFEDERGKARSTRGRAVRDPRRRRPSATTRGPHRILLPTCARLLPAPSRASCPGTLSACLESAQIALGAGSPSPPPGSGLLEQRHRRRDDDDAAFGHRQRGVAAPCRSDPRMDGVESLLFGHRKGPFTGAASGVTVKACFISYRLAPNSPTVHCSASRHRPSRAVCPQGPPRTQRVRRSESSID